MYFKSENGIYSKYFICTNEKINQKNTGTRMHGSVSIREQIGGFGKDEESVYEYLESLILTYMRKTNDMNTCKNYLAL